MTMPGGTLLDLPAAQDALNYALGELAKWQLVPQRVAVATAEVRRLAADASNRGDVATVAQLAFVKQSLDGIGQEYQDAAPLVAEMLTAAQTLQAGGTVGPGLIPDAAKLATTMSANLGALAQNEQAIVQLGGTLTVGPGGGLVIPTWAKWGLIGLGVWFLVRRL